LESWHQKYQYYIKWIMRPIRLLGLHQVGFIGHHVELRRPQGEPSGFQMEMGT